MMLLLVALALLVTVSLVAFTFPVTADHAIGCEEIAAGPRGSTRAAWQKRRLLGKHLAM